MTLGEFARLLDVEPKWVLNRMAELGLPARYTIALARRLTVCRAIHEATGMPLERAIVVASLAQSPEQRLRQLFAIAVFAHRVHRRLGDP